MEAVCIGDLHYDGPNSKFMNLNTSITTECNTVAEWARTHGISNVFLLGDIGHKSKLSYDAIQCFLSLLLDNRDIHFYIILGNHDFDGKNSDSGHSLTPIQHLIKKKAIKNVNIYENPKYIDVDDARIKVLPYPSSDFDESTLNIAHIEVRNSVYPSGRENNSKKLYSGDALIIAGHLHNNQTIRNTHYTGTLYQTDFGQKYKHGFHHLVYNSIDDYELDWIPHKPKFRLKTVNINSKSDISKIDADKRVHSRLILNCDIDSTEWNNLNVVSTVSKEQYSGIVPTASNLDYTVDVKEYLKAWLEAQSYPDEVIKSVLKARRRYGMLDN